MGSGRAGRPPLPPASVAEAEALAFGLEDMAAAREATEGGCGEPLAAEHLGPPLEGKVRGHDKTLPLICRAQDVKSRTRRASWSEGSGLPSVAVPLPVVPARSAPVRRVAGDRQGGRGSRPPPGRRPYRTHRTSFEC